jgi:hypothetical protein
VKGTAHATHAAQTLPRAHPIEHALPQLQRQPHLATPTPSFFLIYDLADLRGESFLLILACLLVCAKLITAGVAHAGA